jgi:serine/threonine-protein kinase RsbW
VESKAVLRIDARLESLSSIRRFVQEAGMARDAGPAALRQMLLAVDEASTNIIVHGYRGQDGTIEVEVAREGENLIIRLRDTAEPFDPTTVPPPDLTAPLQERPIGGLGIQLVRQVMDGVSHRITPEGGNELTLVRRCVDTAKEDTHADNGTVAE